MLPFLKKSQDGASSSPVEHITREPDEGTEEEYDSMESAAEDLCNAVHSKNYKAVASALRAAFELAESEPHEEGPHE